MSRGKRKGKSVFLGLDQFLAEEDLYGAGFVGAPAETGAESLVVPEPGPSSEYYDNEFEDQWEGEELAWVRSQRKGILPQERTDPLPIPHDYNLAHIRLRERFPPWNPPTSKIPPAEYFRVNIKEEPTGGNAPGGSGEKIDPKRLDGLVSAFVRCVFNSRTHEHLEVRKQLFDEMKYLSRSTTYPMGPSLAAYFAKNDANGIQRVFFEYENSNEALPFAQIRNPPRKSLQTKRLDWSTEAQSAFETKSHGIPGRIDNTVIEVAVPGQEFKLQIGTGGSCEFVPPDAPGCSYLWTPDESITREHNETGIAPYKLSPPEHRRLMLREKKNLGLDPEEDDEGHLTTLFTFNNPAAGTEFRERQPQAYKAPPDFLIGKYVMEKFKGTEVKLRLRWQRRPISSATLVLSDPSLVLYACDLIKNSSSAFARPLYNSNTGRLVICRLPTWLRKPEQVTEWACSILGPCKVKIARTIIRRQDDQELSEWLIDTLSYLLSQLFVRSGEHVGAYGREQLVSLEQYCNDYQRLPWKFTFNSWKNENEVTIHFQNPAQGYAIVDELLRVRDIDNLRMNPSDRFGPEYLPQYSIECEVPRALRVLCNDDIWELSREIQAECKPPEQWARIGEPEFQNHNNLRTSRIAVYGWPKSFVDERYQKLHAIFAPEVYKVAPDDEAGNWLFYGYGAACLDKHLKNSDLFRKTAVDIDATRRKISIWGNRKGKLEALRRIRELARNRNCVSGIMGISVAPPRFPRGFPMLLNLLDAFEHCGISGIAQFIGGRRRLELDFDPVGWAVSINGTVSDYENLVRIVDGLDEELWREFALNEQHSRDKNSNRAPSRTSSRPLCHICTQPLSDDFYKLERCGHVFCRPCLNHQVLYAETSRDAVPFYCVHPDCKEDSRLASSDVLYLLLGAGGGFMLEERAWWLDGEKLEKFTLASLDRLKYQRNSIYFGCVTPSCNGVFQKLAAVVPLPPGLEQSVKKIETTVQCKACSREHCRLCGVEVHPEFGCDEYRMLRADPDRSLSVYAEKKGNKISACPGCSAIIEKAEGCNHMECFKCKLHFCWLCKHRGNGPPDIYKHLAEVHGGAMDGQVEWRFGPDGQLLQAPPDELDDDDEDFIV